MKALDFTTKKYLIDIARNCFWYKNSFYWFLDSCGIPRTFYSHLWDDIYKQGKMRTILEAIERQEKIELFDNLVSNAFRLRLSERDKLPDLKRAQLLLEEFRSYVWNDPIEKEIKKRESQSIQEEYKKSIQETKGREEKIINLKKSFLEVQKNIGSQKAGYDLEKIFFDLINLEGLSYHPPYRTEHEQIDGYFNYEKFDYIVEIKATKDLASNDEFAIFDWKIDGKWQSTRGFFFSINWFTEHSINKYSWNSPRIICMDWEDFYLCLEERFSLMDILKHKVDNFVRKWVIHGKINR